MTGTTAIIREVSASPVVDPEQIRMDLEDARARLTQIQDAILAVDEAADEVRRCTQALRLAKGRLAEAKGKLALLSSRERREGNARKEARKKS